MDKQPSCEERINSHLESRMEYIGNRFAWANLWERAHQWDRAEAARDALNDMPLSVDVIKQVRIDLSTGGPADYLVYDLNNDNEIVGITYHFADWWDHAERRLSTSSDEYETAEQFLYQVAGDPRDWVESSREW